MDSNDDEQRVWVSTCNRNGNRSRYHSDPDCPRLQTIKPENRAEKALSAIHTHRSECKECSGIANRHRPTKYTKEMRELLLEMDVSTIIDSDTETQ